MRQVQSELENAVYEQSKVVEAEALAVIKKSPKYAIKMLTDFTATSGEETLAAWKAFGEKIIVKYNDLVVKSEKNGKIERSNTGLAGKITRPGYSVDYWKKVVDETGDRYLIPAAK